MARKAPVKIPEPFVICGLAGLFLITRVINFYMAKHEAAAFIANDMSYYTAHVFQLVENGTDLRTTMLEYPLPAVWILEFCYHLGGGWSDGVAHWAPFFSVFMLVLDALVAITLYRRGRAWPCLFWILFVATNGAIAWYRLDMIPAALVAWFAIFLVSRPSISGAALAIGAGVKLWPALLAFPMATPRLRRDSKALRRLISFLIVGVGLGLASLIAVGWHRSISPVTWQSERGLQIESVPATPLMFIRTFTDNPNFPMSLSDYNAIELLPSTPEAQSWVDFLLLIAQILTVVSFLLTAWLTYRLVRAFNTEDERFVEALALVILALVLATIIVNKTLSTQYILWLGGPAAALLLHRRSESLRRHTHVIAVSLIIIGGLTQYIYPWGIYGIMGTPLGVGLPTAMLILRNVWLVALTCYVTWLAVKATAVSPERTDEVDEDDPDQDHADQDHPGDPADAREPATIG